MARRRRSQLTKPSDIQNINRLEIETAYKLEISRFNALSDEIAFILKAKLEKTGIKLHGIEHRVKLLDSILRKCEQKKCTSPFSEFDDIVGARVICLFKDDMEEIGRVIEKYFTVESTDDKRSDDRAPLGYLSIHYTCKMPKTYKGPRYEDASDIEGGTRDWSDLVHEIKAAGYTNLTEVERDLDRGLPFFEEFERDNNQINYYTKTGAARGSLFIASPQYEGSHAPSTNQKLNAMKDRARQSLFG